MAILQQPQAGPKVILIDWHATLVDTHDAMYHAVDDVLPRLAELGLLPELLAPEQSKTFEDAKLVRYVREHRHLHPKIVAQRKISRTDIFQVLFGENEQAKRRAHEAFDAAYHRYVGMVHALEPDARTHLQRLRALGLRLGLISNRSRRFMQHELQQLDDGSWPALFDVMVCGDDVARRKPAPDMLLEALRQLDAPAHGCWYLGDSTTDIIAAHEAGVTALFYNGAGWEQSWLDKIFPGTLKHPYRPHGVVASLGELVVLARRMLAQQLRVVRAR